VWFVRISIRIYVKNEMIITPHSQFEYSKSRYIMYKIIYNRTQFYSTTQTNSYKTKINSSEITQRNILMYIL